MEDCRTNPCDLCKRRVVTERCGVFLNGPETVCPDCIAADAALFDRIFGEDEDSSLSLWEVGSAGWVGQPVCDRCGEEIDVIIGPEEG